MDEADPRLETVWQTVREQFGGSSYEVASGEFNTVLLVDSNPEKTGAEYIVKVPHGNTKLDQHRLAYETRVIQQIHQAPEAPPIDVPYFIEKSHNIDEPAWAAFTFVSGDAFSYREVQEHLSKKEKHAFGHKVGEAILWLSQAISLDTYYQELDPPPPTDRDQMFRQVSQAALSLDKTSFPSLHRMTDAQMADQEWFHNNGILSPRIIGHDDIRPGNLAFTNKRGKWRLTGLFDFGMTAPSTPEREARHVRLLGGFASHHTLGAYYGVRNPAVDGPVIPGTDQFAETVTTFWAYAQALTNAMWRMKHGRPVGSAPMKFDKLYKVFDWSELDVDVELGQLAVGELLDTGRH